MTCIQPTHGGIANLTAASSDSQQDLADDGIAWGDNVAEADRIVTGGSIDSPVLFKVDIAAVAL